MSALPICYAKNQSTNQCTSGPSNQEAETNELIDRVYDGCADKLFAALLGRKKLSAEQIEKLKQIVGEATTQTEIIFADIVALCTATSTGINATARGLSATSIEYVHIRRFDSMTKLVLIATVCVHWFNPLVWVMYIQFQRCPQSAEWRPVYPQC